MGFYEDKTKKNHKKPFSWGAWFFLKKKTQKKTKKTTQKKPVPSLPTGHIPMCQDPQMDYILPTCVNSKNLQNFHLFRYWY